MIKYMSKIMIVMIIKALRITNNNDTTINNHCVSDKFSTLKITHSLWRIRNTWSQTPTSYLHKRPKHLLIKTTYSRLPWPVKQAHGPLIGFPWQFGPPRPSQKLFPCLNHLISDNGLIGSLETRTASGKKNIAAPRDNTTGSGNCLWSCVWQREIATPLPLPSLMMKYNGGPSFTRLQEWESIRYYSPWHTWNERCWRWRRHWLWRDRVVTLELKSRVSKRYSMQVRCSIFVAESSVLTGE